MKNEFQGSCISVPVPAALYVSLVDQLSRSDVYCDEAKTVVTAILQKYLDDARMGSPSQDSTEPALDWSNDWIMFGSPPTTTQARRAKSNQARSDWCIGSGGPSEELRSSQDYRIAGAGA